MNDKAIESFLIQRFPGNGDPKAVRNEISAACKDFVKSGLADSNFLKELCCGSEKKFWSRASEALLAASLKRIGLTPEQPKGGGGPDLFVIAGGQKIWIEITSIP